MFADWRTRKLQGFFPLVVLIAYVLHCTIEEFNQELTAGCKAFLLVILIVYVLDCTIEQSHQEFFLLKIM